MLPRLALSVRQPWAYALAMGWKPLENRSWRVLTPPRQHRGEFCIHAAKGMTRKEYEEAAEFFEDLGYSCPPPSELKRGGIVGRARVVDVVKHLDSPWFFGPRGLVIADAVPVDFIPAVGRLDFFAWTPADATIVPAAAKWMLPRPARAEQARLPIDDCQGRLFR